MAERHKSRPAAASAAAELLPPLEPCEVESETIARFRHSALAFVLASTTRCAAAASLNVRKTTGSSVGARRISSIAARTDASCAGRRRQASDTREVKGQECHVWVCSLSSGSSTHLFIAFYQRRRLPAVQQLAQAEPQPAVECRGHPYVEHLGEVRSKFRAAAAAASERAAERAAECAGADAGCARCARCARFVGFRASASQLSGASRAPSTLLRLTLKGHRTLKRDEPRPLELKPIEASAQGKELHRLAGLCHRDRRRACHALHGGKVARRLASAPVPHRAVHDDD